jgi:hypothetical protein
MTTKTKSRMMHEETADLRAALADRATTEQPYDLHFNATRLRNVAALVGLKSAIPEDDATLDGARGAVLGMIAGKLRSAPVTDLAAAILAIPLPEPWIRDLTTKDQAARDHFALDQVRDLLTAAAALIKQVPTQATSDDIQELPPLPENKHAAPNWTALYTADQMRDYAHSALAKQVPAQEQDKALYEKAVVLLNHLEDVLDDENFSKIDSKLWNAVTMHYAAQLAQSADTAGSDHG